MAAINKTSLFGLFLTLFPTLWASDALPMGMEAEVYGMAGGSSGDFAPYYISSLRQGRMSSRWGTQLEASLVKPMPLDTRFSYGFGADVVGGWQSSTDYQRYSNGTWSTHGVHTSRFWIQQLYGEVKYRGAFLRVGIKDERSALLNQELSSGDLVESGNARGIPQARAGFVDFQDVPFTHGWLQIQGEIGFGPMTDDGWMKDQYNYYTDHIALNQWYNYKRCYFRVTPPSRRWAVTVGMQAAAMFGGDTRYYRQGKLVREEHRNVSVGDFFKMWLPTQGSNYYEGNHLGSWDLRADYTLKDGAKLSAYFEWPWEDGSGIGRANGWDGVWGLEWKSSNPGWFTGAVVEYLDFTNQSGPLYFNPDDYPGTTLHGNATGGDSYYNNEVMGPYANYGMSIGTPALIGPLYNLDGFPSYLYNRMRGFHIAVQGSLTSRVSWLLKGGYRRSWGAWRMTLPSPKHLTAVMAQASWQADDHLSLQGMVELDRGSLPGNAFGGFVTLTYKL